MMAFRGLFEWSERDHSLREVVEVFQRHLPILAIVSEGYSGRDGMHEFASDEVYWIFDVQKQEKVVAKEALERFVSIPVDYPVPFQKILSGRPVGPAMSMAAIIDDGGYRGERIRFKDNVHISFKFGADDGSSDQFGEMEIVETYSEKYLLCHSIVKKEIHPMVIGIPAYVPIRMEVAEGFAYDTKESFGQWMKEVADISRNLENSQIVLRQEILLFHEPPGGDYEYISPLKFTAHSYDSESEEEEENNVSNWQLPQVTFTPKKCYTVARNPIKVCIQPILLPQIPVSQSRGRNTSAQDNRSNNFGFPKLPPRMSKTIDRKCPPSFQKSSKSLPREMKPGETLQVGRSLDREDREADHGWYKSRTTSRLPQKSTTGDMTKIDTSELPAPKSPPVVDCGPPVPRRAMSIPEDHQSFHSHTLSFDNNRSKPQSKMPRTPNFRTLETSSPTTKPLVRSKTSDWKTLEDVPTNVDVSEFSVDQVARCLELLDLHMFISAFRQMTVDGKMLLELEKPILVEDFGLSKLEALRLYMFAHKWRPNMKHDS